MNHCRLQAHGLSGVKIDFERTGLRAIVDPAFGADKLDF
jgi:hypothetical protein